MKRPVIIIFPKRDENLSGISMTYTDAIRTHGGIPLILPLNTDSETLKDICDIADGFLFTGGLDVSPSYYGEEVLNDTVSVDSVRDTLEMTAMKFVLESGKPILGICRGIQSVNVGMGGTLYQDIPSQTGTAIRHRQTEKETVPTHEVITVPGTKLNGLVGDRLMTNSFHHQAVKTPAKGLTVSARASDGVIEGLESATERYILLVQWHPEHTHSTDPCSDAIFRDFIEAAGKR